MTILRMDHVSVVVEDLEAGVAFFVALGMEVEGRAQVEGASVDRLNGIGGVKAEIVMVRTPDGHGRLELTRFASPAPVGAGQAAAPPNALGLRSVMFEVDDVDATVARLRGHGAELVGGIEQYGDTYRLCYLRGPQGIIVALAQKLG